MDAAAVGSTVVKIEEGPFGRLRMCGCHLALFTLRDKRLYYDPKFPFSIIT
jgi:hypothetical protein